jgi:hypothetical protein
MIDKVLKPITFLVESLGGWGASCCVLILVETSFSKIIN